MAKTPAQVAAWAKRHKDEGIPVKPGMCLKFSREAAGAPGGVYDAVTAWRNADHKHPGSTNAPRGSFVFWSGGGSGHGHVAVSAGGDDIYSTDLPRSRRVGRVPLSMPRTRWGLHYLGWSEDINGVHIRFDEHAPAEGGGGGKVTKTTGVYVVDKAKVSSFLWGVKHSTGKRVFKRKPGFKIKTGVRIVTIGGRKWLVTKAGYRYALSYLKKI